MLRPRPQTGHQTSSATGTDGSEVLLHLRRGTGYRDGHWALVAGHVEGQESVLDAAVREAREEVGVDVALDDLLPLTTVHRTVLGGGPIEQRVDVFLMTRRWDGEPQVREPAKNAGLGWWSLAGVAAGRPTPCVPHELDVLRRLAAAEAGGPAVPAVLTAGF